MPPVERPGGGPGERTEGGSGECTEDGPGECTEDGPGERTEDGPGDGTPDGPGDGTGDGPRDGTGGHPGYRTPGDPGGCGRFWYIFLIMRWLGPFFRLTWSSHICKLGPPRKTWILARETSRGTPDARRRRQDAGWLGRAWDTWLGTRPELSNNSVMSLALRLCPSQLGGYSRPAFLPRARNSAT
jgi:hypothetical protein